MSTETVKQPGSVNEAEDVAGLAASGCYASGHDFKEEYYGWRCSKCGIFYPNTCPLENWLMNETYEPDRH